MATPKRSWYKNGSCLFLNDMSPMGSELKGIYTIGCTPTGQLYLEEMADKFDFGFKIYGLEKDFIRRIVKSYKNRKGNLGVLLNGIKGTGKTITAEILANELGLPIILVNQNMGGLNEFITSIPQDVTIFIDEYEKTFKGMISEEDADGDKVATGDSTLLSLMDGVYKTPYRRMFLLTTNKAWVNESMLGRPGRIRYFKEFGDLQREQIDEIIDDLLKVKKFKQDIIDFMKPMQIITVDVVKAIISEVNLFNEPPDVCCKHINVQFKEDKYAVYQILKNGKEKKIEGEVALRHVKNLFRVHSPNYFNTNECTYYITKKLGNDTFMVYTDSQKVSDAFKIRVKKDVWIHSSLVI